MQKNKQSDLVWEDEGLIAVNKLPGLLTIPDRFNTNAPNLLGQLQTKYPGIIPVHRLDKFTSGVVLFAKNSDQHKKMSELFEKREVEKYYTAIAEGRFTQDKGEIHAALAESMTTRGKMVINKRGKDSITKYKVVRQFDRFALVSLQLMTGRMHQIRVHLQYIGHPLAVDPLYGQREALYLSEIKIKRFNIGKFKEEKPLLTRQPLHATKLVFIHPDSGVRVECTAELPKDMTATIRQLEKWG
jgi:23S rRNA pseudouridine1911/1915/1917 synthase